MTTIKEASSRSGYAIPAANEQHQDEFHVSVQLSDRTTKCYSTANTNGWEARVRSFVKRAHEKADCRIDTVRISHVDNGKRLSQKKWSGDELSFTDYLSH
ncbi:hypothetical protein [Salinibacter altiplanensis]|uniref:hypothetical protein n=1 Tax=Salinibacter altiplanensis TaxID=1803181 RepID=UPI000C9FC42E|nr:hypothetical protein [Salinibacter altiplanensis]